MKVWVVAVGRPGRLLAGAIEEYERRAGRYWTLDCIQVKEEKAAEGRADSLVRAAEAERLLARVPAGAEIVALTRGGTEWSSREFARYLDDLAVRGRTGAAFLLGGARGLGGEVLSRAERRITLSALTLPHELARLVLAEQLYRAGTILRGEPYHKALD